MLDRRPILAFLADERGSESVEFGLVSLSVGWIAINLRLRLRAVVDGQIARAVAEIDAAE